MRHGRFANGLRKVELTDDLGRVSTLHLRGDVPLREAIGDVWKASREDDGGIAIEHWSKVRAITARCGDEIEEFTRASEDWINSPCKPGLTA
jgi:hypothetical protein